METSNPPVIHGRYPITAEHFRQQLTAVIRRLSYPRPTCLGEYLSLGLRPILLGTVRRDSSASGYMIYCTSLLRYIDTIRNSPSRRSQSDMDHERSIPSVVEEYGTELTSQKKQ
ncbi:hypothetical protein WG66_009430 [Moniliophthora roreri]|nr:hypothetical protein WG66_009430 [Moniliophthora roreri]